MYIHHFFLLSILNLFRQCFLGISPPQLHNCLFFLPEIILTCWRRSRKSNCPRKESESREKRCYFHSGEVLGSHEVIQPSTDSVQEKNFLWRRDPEDPDGSRLTPWTINVKSQSYSNYLSLRAVSIKSQGVEKFLNVTLQTTQLTKYYMPTSRRTTGRRTSRRKKVEVVFDGQERETGMLTLCSLIRDHLHCRGGRGSSPPAVKGRSSGVDDTHLNMIIRRHNMSFDADLEKKWQESVLWGWS